MKTAIKCLIILLLKFNLSLPNLNLEPYVIGCYISGGFFSIFITILNNLEWCDKNNKTPVVYWNNQCLYFQNEGYNGSFNAWEYYFEPVSNLNYENFKNIITSIDLFGPDRMGIQHGVYNGYQMISCRFRANEIIKKYIKIKPNILNKINEFYKLNMENKNIIGIHLRGTDKPTEVKPVDPMIIIDEANKFVGYEYFVATDDEKLLNVAIKNLNGRVFFYNCERSQDGSAVHKNNNLKNKALQGEEALIDAILLSRCNKLLHTDSNLSYAAHYFNPNLGAILFVNGQTPQSI